VTDEKDNVFSRLRSRSEELVTQLSGELMSNPQFSRAVQHALKGRQFLDDAAARALKQANIPTRTEFKRALARVGELEAELSELRERLERIEKAGRTRRKSSPAKPKSGRKAAR
jgi:hypothetical protein